MDVFYSDDYGVDFQHDLNNSGERGHPCPASDLRRESSVSSVEYEVSCGFVTWGISYVEYIPLNPFWCQFSSQTAADFWSNTASASRDPNF